MAAGVKVMPLTSVFAEMDTSVVFERPNIAMSAGPLGTSIGVQLAAVFQSPEMGSRSHCAVIAYITVGTRNSSEQRIAARISLFIEVISGFAIDVRDYQAANPGSPFGEPNSPQTSIKI